MGKRTVVSLLAALAQFALAYNAVTGASLVIDAYARRGISAEMCAGILVAAGVLLIVYRNWLMFVLATLPYLLYVGMAVDISIERSGGLGQSIIYIFSLVQMYVLYFCDDGCSSEETYG